MSEMRAAGRATKSCRCTWSHPDSGVVRPIKELRGFQRIALQPNETRTVRLELKARELTYWDAAQQSFVVEPGGSTSCWARPLPMCGWKRRLR